MMKLARTMIAAVTLAAACQAQADTIEFDTVTAYQAGYSAPSSVTGIARNTTASVTLSYTSAYEDGRCTAAILTMMEKPGRYFLTLITMDSQATYETLERCILTLRN